MFSYFLSIILALCMHINVHSVSLIIFSKDNTVSQGAEHTDKKGNAKAVSL